MCTCRRRVPARRAAERDALHRHDRRQHLGTRHPSLTSARPGRPSTAAGSPVFIHVAVNPAADVEVRTKSVKLVNDYFIATITKLSANIFRTSKSREIEESHFQLANWEFFDYSTRPSVPSKAVGNKSFRTKRFNQPRDSRLSRCPNVEVQTTASRQHLGSGYTERGVGADGAAAAEPIHLAELPAQLLHLLRHEPAVPRRLPRALLPLLRRRDGPGGPWDIGLRASRGP